MAPEVLKDNAYSAKGDIWSLGVVLLEMLIGELPWSHADFSELRKTILSMNMYDLLPSNLESKEKVLLLMCLEVNPKKRCGIL